MKPPFHPNFDRMDALSQERMPFFFIADFLMHRVEVYTIAELCSNEIRISFPKFSHYCSVEPVDSSLNMQAFPETLDDYKKGFRTVQDNLKFGNSYLMNYTRKTEITVDRTLDEIFHLVEAKYKVLYRDMFVFFSPETFIEIAGDRIFTHPMKGTIDASLPNAAEALKNDKKEKAEHYTVVDLLRNDLSMVADDVQLDAFQRIDFIKTRQKDLFAMSSEISGKLKPEFNGKVGSILKTLLPAGSILGAPKKKTLEILLEAEKYDRGFYTGVCGWFDGANLDSCVMIRFMEKEGDKLFFKSGGGITHLSRLEDEYEEMKNKIYVPVP